MSSPPPSPKGGGDELSERLAVMRRNGMSLLHLITEILDFSRFDASAMPVELAPCELVADITTALESMRPMAQLREIQLLPLEGPETMAIMADARLLIRALLNLVVNAIKYCRPGDEVRVQIATDAGRLHIDVVDTGPGIPRDQHDRVFERFQRSRDGRGRLIEGSGIGLAMVRDIVDLHGGELTLKSEPGQGCRFRMDLPLRPSEVSSTEGAAANDSVAELSRLVAAGAGSGARARPAVIPPGGRRGRGGYRPGAGGGRQP